MKNIVVFGSTGSVGKQVLEVVRLYPEKLRVEALCAGSNIQCLTDQILEFKPSYFWHNSAEYQKNICNATRLEPNAMVSLENVDIVVMAASGSVCMKPTITALEHHKTVALANKEIMVIAGEVIIEQAKKGGKIIPVDSEPSAIWQCLLGESAIAKRLIITASGGAFRGRKWEELHNVSPSQALRHPTYSMGKKITIDSATLVNKAFEVIESHWMFSMPFNKIDVVIHPQSIIHSMVEFYDQSFKALLSTPDMRYPISYALFYPERLPCTGTHAWNPISYSNLTFEPMNMKLYPCFDIAMEYGRRKGTWPAALAGADESAVELFLSNRIPFTLIPNAIQYTMDAHTPTIKPTLLQLMESYNWGKDFTKAKLNKGTL